MGGGPGAGGGRGGSRAGGEGRRYPPVGPDEDGKVSAFEVKVGDRVLISKYGGTEVKIENDKFTLVREDDILGVLV